MARQGQIRLWQRNGVFWYRQAVPKDIQPAIGLSEVRYSLHTSNRRLAARRCRTVSNQIEGYFDAARTMSGTKQNIISDLIRGYFQTLRAKAEEEAMLLPDDPIALSRLDRETKLAAAYEQELRQKAIARAYDKGLVAQATAIFTDAGKKVPPVASQDFQEVCDGLMRAKVESARIYKALISGDYTALNTTDPLFEGIGKQPLPLMPGETPPADPHSVAQLIAKYIEHKTKTGAWVGKTVADNQRCLGWFEQIPGSALPITSLTVDHVRTYRDYLLALPSNFVKQVKLKDMSFIDLAKANAKGEQPSLSYRTAKKYLENIKAFLNWCEAEGYIGKAPTGKITIQIKESAIEARHPFSQNDINALFNSGLYRGFASSASRHLPGDKMQKDGYFWIPVIGLFSGMRLGEIVQLLVSDVKQSGDVIYFDISLAEDETKKLKTKSAKRIVPVHPTLISMGLAEHVEARRKAEPQGRIFPEIKPGKDGYYSHNFSKWFGRYLKHIGLKNSKLTFHSFRHSFVHGLRVAGIDEARTKIFIGHRDKGVTAAYGAQLPADVLYQDIAKVILKLPAHVFPAGKL